MIYTKVILSKICIYLDIIDLFTVKKVCKLYNLYISHDKEQYIFYNMYKIINNVEYDSKSNYYKLLLTKYHRYIINLNINLTLNYKTINKLLIKKCSLLFDYELRLKKIMYDIEITKGNIYYINKYNKYKDKYMYLSNKKSKIDEEIKEKKDLIYEVYNINISEQYLNDLRLKIIKLKLKIDSID